MRSDFPFQLLFDMGIPQKADKFRKESAKMSHYQSPFVNSRSTKPAIFLERIPRSF